MIANAKTANKQPVSGKNKQWNATIVEEHTHGYNHFSSVWKSKGKPKVHYVEEDKSEQFLMTVTLTSDTEHVKQYIQATL